MQCEYLDFLLVTRATLSGIRVLVLGGHLEVVETTAQSLYSSDSVDARLVVELLLHYVGQGAVAEIAIYLCHTCA